MDLPGGSGFSFQLPSISTAVRNVCWGAGLGGFKLMQAMDRAVRKGREYNPGTYAEATRRAVANERLKEAMCCWQTENAPMWTKALRKAKLYSELVLRVDFSLQKD